MSQIASAIDQQYVEDQTIKAWNSWNINQRLIWLQWNDLPLTPYGTYEDLPNEVKDALFVEYLDNAKRDQI